MCLWISLGASTLTISNVKYSICGLKYNYAKMLK
jgi:hypothetical protein